MQLDPETAKLAQYKTLGSASVWLSSNFASQTTLHTGPKRETFLLLPIVPPDRSGVKVVSTYNGKNWDTSR
jgi:hypothetical protein